jgi:hypothetical protein
MSLWIIKEIIPKKKDFKLKEMLIRYLKKPMKKEVK